MAINHQQNHDMGNTSTDTKCTDCSTVKPRFADIIAHDGHAIEMIFISDLHLSPSQPALMQAFLALLEQLSVLPRLRHLYILGDWFDAWLGDDIANTKEIHDWLSPMMVKLRQLHHASCQIHVLGGNRDFLLGQDFCDEFGGIWQKEPLFLHHHNLCYRLEHGDHLCTDDKKYQTFRSIIQHPLTKQLLLSLSLKTRQNIAQKLRQKSKADNAKKSMNIMDVNDTTVKNALSNADILVHGHTHRPAIHGYPTNINDQNRPTHGQKKRVVLGDWRVYPSMVTAHIGYLLSDDVLTDNSQLHNSRNTPQSSSRTHCRTQSIQLCQFDYLF